MDSHSMGKHIVGGLYLAAAIIAVVVGAIAFALGAWLF